MTDLIDFATLLHESDRIAWSGVAMEPSDLLGRLEAQLDAIPAGTSCLLNIALTDTLDAERLAARMRITALGGSVTNRRFDAIGALEVLPINYGTLPDLVASGQLPIDCVLVQVAPDGTTYNRSLLVDYLTDAIPHARTVIAEVNDQLPVTFGETAIAAADIDHVVTVSRKPIEMPSRPARAIEQEISRHVRRLINDGDTLEVGLGSLPDAVLEGLTDKRDLGLHSGTIGDRVVELVEAGVITNARKPIDTGRCVTATLLGTNKLYSWAHQNPRLELRSPRYTHDTIVHAQIPRFMAINSALEIDLTGQVNSETIGSAHVGVIGGQSDFMRGAIRSPGGRNIIVMESTARQGTVSRIRTRFDAGIVTTTRSDADVVVTEYGIAELRGRTVPERAEALVAIAHPDFRADLQKATDSGLV